MELLLTRILENLLLPPAINMIMLVVGVLIVSRFYRTGIFLILTGFFTLVVLSLPITAHFLNLPNQNIKPIAEKTLRDTTIQAIIVLGGGRYREAPEYQQDTVSTVTLSRIRYAALLHRKTKLPILTTGGAVFGHGTSEAELMQHSLSDDFNIKTKWLEKNSRNTKENAVFSFKILQQKNVVKIILVTDVTHMGRAKPIFENAGFEVMPAPINFDTAFKNKPLYLSLIPTSAGLHKSHSVLREYMGQLWYFIRY